MTDIKTSRHGLHFMADTIKNANDLDLLYWFSQAVYVGGYADLKYTASLAARCIKALRLTEDEVTGLYLALMRSGMLKEAVSL